MAENRFFSVAQARSLLPAVRHLASEMVQTVDQLWRFGPDLELLAELSDQNAGSPQGTEYLHHLLQLHLCIKKIHDLGCLVKGVEDGLIDFPHMKNGRQVYLCWKLGEDDIAFWHEVNSGYDGRIPLEDETDAYESPPK